MSLQQIHMNLKSYKALIVKLFLLITFLSINSFGQTGIAVPEMSHADAIFSNILICHFLLTLSSSF